MLNVIAVIICTIGAIGQWKEKNMPFGLVEAILALVNFPFAIEWLCSFI